MTNLEVAQLFWDEFISMINQLDDAYVDRNWEDIDSIITDNDTWVFIREELAKRGVKNIVL